MDITNLELWQTARVSDRLEVTRVHGGYLYHYNGVTSTFVPFNSEIELDTDGGKD